MRLTTQALGYKWSLALAPRCHPQKYFKFFDPRSNNVKVWDSKTVRHKLIATLGSCGLDLTSNGKRKDKMVYRLDPEKVNAMLELVKLRTTRMYTHSLTASSEHAVAALEAARIVRWAHLIDNVAARLTFNDEEEQAASAALGQDEVDALGG